MCAAGDYDGSVIETNGDAKEVWYYNSRLNLQAEDDNNLPLACGVGGKAVVGTGEAQHPITPQNKAFTDDDTVFL